MCHFLKGETALETPFKIRGGPCPIAENEPGPFPLFIRNTLNLVGIIGSKFPDITPYFQNVTFSFYLLWLLHFLLSSLVLFLILEEVQSKMIK